MLVVSWGAKSVEASSLPAALNIGSVSARWLEWLFGQNWLHVCTFGQKGPPRPWENRSCRSTPHLGRLPGRSRLHVGTLRLEGIQGVQFQKEKSSQQSEVQTSIAPVPSATVAQSASRCRRL
ncbi:hypothetical protein HPB47_008450 [Ixodes persulcatus]|uniref:Uncharacterized protein n=1 Tax=Ixodes persulcatus TaxID=34615 RepID=A0AC60P5J3_IXOPE|nr:hypothetical protein HPB47_008450 [Ixodes persulcatus]